MSSFVCEASGMTWTWIKQHATNSNVAINYCLRHPHAELRSLRASGVTSFFWASSSFIHCLTALDLGAGVQQPFGCFYGAPFVKILYLTDLAQELLSLHAEIAISACRDSAEACRRARFQRALSVRAFSFCTFRCKKRRSSPPLSAFRCKITSLHAEIAISARDSSFCAKSVRYNIFTNGAPYITIMYSCQRHLETRVSNV